VILELAMHCAQLVAVPTLVSSSMIIQQQGRDNVMVPVVSIQRP
jgi:hypothetical protein